MRVAVGRYRTREHGGGERVHEIIVDTFNADSFVMDYRDIIRNRYAFKDYDVFISTHNRCKIIKHENHINYCHHVPKEVYMFKTARFRLVKEVVDKLVTRSVKHIIANSEKTQEWVRRVYGRKADVLYPPIEVKKYKNKQPEDYFLYIGRLNFEKHIEDMVLACYLNDSKLVVVGDGEHKDYYLKLFEQYEGVVEYRGWVDEKEKIDLLAHCKALVLPTYHEDYGIVFAEAVASGKPIVTNDTCYPAWVIRKHPSVGVSIPWFSDSSVRAVNYAFALSELERMYSDGEVDVSPAMDYVLDISDFKKRIRRIVEEQLNKS